MMKDDDQLDITPGSFINYEKHNSPLADSKDLLSDISPERLRLFIQLLLRNQSFLKKLIESLPHPFYVIDFDKHEIEISNQAAKEFLNLNRTNHECYRSLKTENCCGTHSHCPVIFIKNDKKETIVEQAYQMPDGNLNYYEIHAYPYYDKSGKLSKMIEYCLDITRRKNMEQGLQIEKKKLEESEKKYRKLSNTKDKLFRIIAHDLKNPVHSILGFSELLADEFENLSPEEQKEHIQFIKQSAGSIHNLIDNLLNWSRSQTGDIDYHPETFDLKTVTDQVVELHHAQANKKSIDISQNIPRNTEVVADKNMIEAVLRNLTSNAIKFTHNGGKISFDARTGKEVTVIISDNGVGMEQSRLEKLFQIENKSSNTGTSGETGTGLGLILVKDFIEKNGGKIHIESSAGKGTVIIFTLPNPTPNEAT